MDADNTNILIYQTEDGSSVTEVRLESDSVWLRQDQMADLFGRERSVISKHRRNVFAESELAEGQRFTWPFVPAVLPASASFRRRQQPSRRR